MVTVAIVEGWMRDGIENSYEYMLVVEDELDYGFFPVYSSEADFEELYSQICHDDLQKVIEVYEIKGMRVETVHVSSRRTFDYPASFLEKHSDKRRGKYGRIIL